MSHCRLKYVLTNTSDRFCLCIPSDCTVADTKERIRSTLSTNFRYHEMVTKPNADIVLKLRLDDGFDYQLFPTDGIKHIVGQNELVVATIETFDVTPKGIVFMVYSNTTIIVSS